MIPDDVLDTLDGCEVDMSRAQTSVEQLRALLGARGGEPEPDESEDEHELRHRPG